MMPNSVMPDKLLWSAKQVGEAMSLSRRQIFRLHSAGKIPAAIRIVGAVRWSAQECAAWIAAGAPDRKTWEAMNNSKK